MPARDLPKKRYDDATHSPFLTRHNAFAHRARIAGSDAADGLP